MATVETAPPLRRQSVFSRLQLFRCPVTGQPLTVAGDALVSADGRYRYRVRDGIPLFAEQFVSDEAKAQQSHYDSVAAAYVTNLGYPHTRAYMEYMDEVLESAVGTAPLGVTAEICCGHGEAMGRFGGRMDTGVGVDVSEQMLRSALAHDDRQHIIYVQGDATSMPLADSQFDTVFMLGGIHHVSDRRKLFSEVFRILKPGGRFIFREPLNDFFVWQALRALIYRISSGLDHETERPLRWKETVPYLQAAGFEADQWEPLGFLGFCLFMNSDILVFNRLFRFIPKIREITLAATRFDRWALRWKAIRSAGLQVVGVAHRPEAFHR
jgi:ubiquinone/menaquinone biosynthesis C-methylase UbiE